MSVIPSSWGQKKRKSKYGNTPTVIDGIRFASKAEAHRYAELLLLSRAKVISDLQLQPRFPLVVNGFHVAVYVGDFSYFCAKTKRLIVEDVKSLPTQTEAFKLKAKLMKAIHGIEITIISV